MIGRDCVVAGTRHTLKNAIEHDGPNPMPNTDPPLKGAPERPCSCCGARFKPTQRRRMLCSYCYRHDGQSGIYLSL